MNHRRVPRCPWCTARTIEGLNEKNERTRIAVHDRGCVNGNWARWYDETLEDRYA